MESGARDPWAEKKMWTAIVVTCPHQAWCAPLQQELAHLPAHLILVVPDPGHTDIKTGGGGGVGSGGATLNALLVVTEHLSARAGHSTVVAELLRTARILVLHVGPALLPLPTGLLYVGEEEEKETSLPVTNLERTVKVASMLVKSFSAGVMICSTDILLSGSLSSEPLQSQVVSQADILLYTVSANPDYATAHGVAVTGEQDSTVQNILYQPSAEELRGSTKGDTVNILGGLVWIEPHVAEALLRLHCLSPIDCCTYLGVDSGEPSLQVSLYYDLLPAACSAVSQAEFVSGHCGKGLMRGRLACPSRAAAARRHVWAELRPFRMRMVALPGLQHRYLPLHSGRLGGSELAAQWRLLQPGFYCQTAATCWVDEQHDVIWIDSLVSATDSQLPAGSIVFGRINPKKDEHTNAMRQACSNGDGLIVLVYPVADQRSHVTVVFSARDALFLPCSHPEATLLGLPWVDALDGLSLCEMELWPADLAASSRCLYTARLYAPSTGGARMSIKEASERLNMSRMLSHRRHLHQQIVSLCLETGEALPGRSKYLRLFELSVAEGWSRTVLAALDRAAQRTVAAAATTLPGSDCLASQQSSQLARILAMTADLLGCMAAGQGGLRSGPARNPAFMPGLQLLEAGRLCEGLNAWAKARDSGDWLETPARMVRAARHYEGGVQLLIRRTVMSARSQIRVDMEAERAGSLPALGEPVVVSCPARLDLSGGWTDTPPICYELGGRVVDLAIRLDGEQPIGCRAVRIPQLHIEIVLPEEEDEDECMEESKRPVLRIASWADMADYCNPMARGALVKCCLLAAGLINLDAEAQPLEQQLQRRLGGSGLRLELWSLLPQGSGLGTSSILAGAGLAAVWSSAGAAYTRSDLVHAVLVVEQLLSTGGGWQDQVGGLHAGLNMGISLAAPHVVVRTQHCQPSQAFLNLLEDRLLVVYTGRPRLAKNLLQNVIRNWYSQDPHILATFAANLELAETCWTAVQAENLAGLGSCLSRYWELKRALAPGSEPELVHRILTALRPLCYGAGLAGAGGGGFLAAILKEGVSRDEAVEAVSKLAGSESVRFYLASVDQTGIQVTVGEQEVVVPNV